MGGKLYRRRLWRRPYRLDQCPVGHDIVVAKLVQKGFLGPQESFYIASPNFGVAIPSISSLQESFWIMEQLIHAGMPKPDAVTAAQVLQDMNDF